MPIADADRAALVRRVQLALDVAGRVIAAAVDDDGRTPGGPQAHDAPQPEGSGPEVLPLRLRKVVAEATMLLRCADGVDASLAPGIDDVARRLAPHARGESVRAALVRQPSATFDHAAAHVHLRALGFGDALTDALIEASLDGDRAGGPERTPTEDLEEAWLRSIWTGSPEGGLDGLLARTCVARPLDVLEASTRDLYAFTHAVLFASDMGRRRVRLPRELTDVTDDIEAVLAVALDADNLDLVAELLWTWPMLRAEWSPAAAFAFDVLTATADATGYVPGPGHDPAIRDALDDEDRERYVFRTSYHATFVSGFLSAAMLRTHAIPDRGGDDGRDPNGAGRAARAVEDLLADSVRTRRWSRRWAELDAIDRDALAPFLLTMAIRRASAAGDLSRLRDCLSVAVELGITDGPAVRQGVGLLRRATLLARDVATARRPSDVALA